MGKLPPRHIKLTLKPKYHADVIALLDEIEPGKVAATVIEALRVWKRRKQRRRGHTRCEAIQAPAPVESMPKAVTPPSSRSKVSLDVGFDALDG